MKRILKSKKMMWMVAMLLPSLAFYPVQAQQDVLVVDLETALDIALSENPTVKVAEQEIEKKEYAKKGAYGALFPQINFSADYTRTLKKQVMYMDSSSSDTGEGSGGTGAKIPITGPNGEIFELDGDALSSVLMGGFGSSDGIEVGRSNNWSLGFSASMPLVNAQLWKSLTITGMDVDLAIEQARSSKIDMINQVKKSFFNVLLANDSYRVFKDSYDNAYQNYLDVKQKYEQGLVAEYDLIRADVSVKNVEPSVLQAENALMLAKWQLKALMAVDLDLAIEVDGELSDYESRLFGDYLLMSNNLDHNTTLRQIDIQTDQLKESLLLQKYEYLPTLSLTGMYQWDAMNNDFRFKNYRWNPYSIVGVSLSIPIFSGGTRYNNVRQTKVSINQIKLQREDTERNLELAVKQYKDEMSNSIKRFDAAQKGVEQSERGYIIAQKRYDTGAGTLLELNDAELAMTQARLNFNQAIYDYMIAKADLERILGNEILY